jgi:diguanylate cyclase (GGDEF)-like protein
MDDVNAQRAPHAPAVLVVDQDPVQCERLRGLLEARGVTTVDAARVSDARRILGQDDLHLHGAVLDGRMAPAQLHELATEVERRWPLATIVVALAEDATGPTPVAAARVERMDLRGVVDALLLPIADEWIPGSAAEAPSVFGLDVGEVTRTWLELCHWDPMLPPDGAPPPIAPAMVSVVAEALRRPQPLGWGPDPDVERVSEAFAAKVGSIDVVIGQLVCLREALRRHLEPVVPPAEYREVGARVNMVIDRAIAVAAKRMSERLRVQAFIDPLTGLSNRRALQLDLVREIARANRYGRRFSLMVVDLDGLKQVNDRDGHAAGDERLRDLASALHQVLRVGDAAYRIGGDEFVVLLPETSEERVQLVVDRATEHGAPPFSWGTATYPSDAEVPDDLIDLADHRLLEQRRIRRRTAEA